MSLSYAAAAASSSAPKIAAGPVATATLVNCSAVTTTSSISLIETNAKVTLVVLPRFKKTPSTEALPEAEDADIVYGPPT